jgi:NADH dehydrogenase [ubiquinone] 1 alpha subcomplex assembly factor 7
VTPLAERLVARIRVNGPLTIADYMAACLGDPDYGYYMRREPFGRGGDFVTAPEVSQMVGELIGAWCLATWQAMGSPGRFVLAELGPGRGTLMADILRTARVLPGFIEAARVHLIEMSPRLRDAQRVALTQSAERLAWVNRVDDLPAGPLILVANEFFDALPIRQFVQTPRGLAERMVGLGENEALAFGLMPFSEPQPSQPQAASHYPLQEAPHMQEKPRREAGTPSAPFAAKGWGEGPTPIIVETSPTRTAMMYAVAARLARDGGAGLIIDYGYAGPAVGDTLQAVRRHEYANPLAAPGEADLTAHVDFAALATAVREAGASPRSLVTQADFLYHLGLSERATILSEGKDEAARAAIAADVARLATAAGMGELFKVLAISSPGLALPAFDSI